MTNGSERERPNEYYIACIMGKCPIVTVSLVYKKSACGKEGERKPMKFPRFNPQAAEGARANVIFAYEPVNRPILTGPALSVREQR